MKIIEKLLAFVKSLGVGLAFLVPGLKGRRIARDTALDKTLEADAKEISKNFWPPFLTFLLTAIGVLIPMILLWRVMQLSINNAFLLMACLFAGFMAGSIPNTIKDLKGEEIKKHHYLILLLVMILFVVMGVMFVIKKVNVNNLFKLDALTYGVMIPIGMIASLGIAVPGISGGLLLLSLGFYKPLIDLYEVVKNDPSKFGPVIGIFACFLVGVILGYLIFSSIFKELINKHKVTTYFVIIGLIAGSIFVTFYNNQMISYYKYHIQNWEFYSAPFTLFGGAIVTFVIPLILEKFKNNETR